MLDKWNIPRPSMLTDKEYENYRAMRIETLESYERKIVEYTIAIEKHLAK